MVGVTAVLLVWLVQAAETMPPASARGNYFLRRSATQVVMACSSGRPPGRVVGQPDRMDRTTRSTTRPAAMPTK
jgi:hypothetical protein